MPLITQSEITLESLLVDLPLQRSAWNLLSLQLLSLREGLELDYNPVLHRTRLTEHIVVHGETIQEIAVMYYGVPEKWLAIAQQNQIESPYEVWPGQSLQIPGLREQE